MSPDAHCPESVRDGTGGSKADAPAGHLHRKISRFSGGRDIFAPGQPGGGHCFWTVKKLLYPTGGRNGSPVHDCQAGAEEKGFVTAVGHQHGLALQGEEKLL